ncbi:hypothetical protein PG995_010472 [Apiospora arundinis]
MSQLPYPYQLEPYSYRVLPYSPIAPTCCCRRREAPLLLKLKQPLKKWFRPPLPPPQEETFATGITPYKELNYPAKLHRERKAKLHARNDKPSTSRSPYTVFVIIHEVNGVNIDVQVSDDLQDANTEVLRIMARYHPQTFKLVRLRKKAVDVSSGENPENENDKNGDNTSGGVKTEAKEDEDMGAGDDALGNTDKEQERERRFVYLGDWKFVHSGTLKLEAKQGNQVIKISSALKNVRHERTDPKQAKREKRRGTAMAGSGLAEVQVTMTEV